MDRGTIKVLCAVATLALGTLLAACGGVESDDRRANEDIQFGIWLPDDDGALRFKATADVPNEEEQAYGWRVRVAESEQAVKWIETVTLPEAPESWKGVEDDPNVMISDDGRTATTFGIAVPDGGYLGSTWAVSFGDPPGEYEMSVELSDGRQASFVFRLGESADVASGTAADAAT
jgi:hypothetical protein